MDRFSIPYEVIDGQTVEKQTITAIKLLPLLENDNSYGLAKFKSLITF